MRSLAALSFATLSLIAGSTALAQIPNDNIRNAILIPAETRVTRLQGQIVNATIEPGFSGWPDVWYKFEAPISGKIFSQVIGVGYFMWAAAIEGNIDTLDYTIVSELGTSTSYGASNTSINTDNYNVVGGKTYYIGVFRGPQLEAPARTGFDFTYIQVFTADQVSDAFASRSPIGGKKFSISVNLSRLTAETDEPQHSSTTTTSARKTGWMTYTSPTRSLVKLSAESKVSVPMLAVYTGDSLTTLTRVAQSSGSGSLKSFNSTLNFVAEAGVPYAIAADAEGTRAGLFTLSVETTTAAPGFLVRPLSTTVFQGDPALFTATAIATGTPTYQWQRLPFGSKVWENLTDGTDTNPSIYSGALTETLNLSTTTLAMSQDKFRVVITDPATRLRTTSSAVSLFVTEFPAIQTEVLGQVTFDQIEFSQGVPAPSNSGVYFATGLPKGLSINPVTGVISGTVTAKPGAYLVTYGSTNGKKRNPQQFTLLINVAPFSPLLSGPFEALPRTDATQALPVGKVTLNVANTGAYTGSFFSLSDSKAYAFRGQLTLNQDERSVSPAGGLPITISRGKTKPALQLSFTITEPAQSQTDAYATLSVIIHEAGGLFIADTFDGVPLAKFSAANPAPWAGIYTVRLTNETNYGANVTLPEGSGYATVSINASTGAAAMRGRLSEGTVITANLLSSNEAQYRLAQRMHTGVGGSLSGTFALGPRLDDPLLYHSSDFTTDRLYWVKTPDKNYPAGFGALSLIVRIEPWQIPSGTFLKTFALNILGEFKVNIASATVNNGAINNTANPYGLPIDLLMSQTGAVTVPTTPSNPSGNSAGLKITINPKTGLFTGSFTVAEQIVPPAKKPQTRLIKFDGVMFQATNIFTNDIIGEGYFLIPPLIKGAPVTSGLIELRAGEPNSPFGGVEEEESEGNVLTP